VIRERGSISAVILGLLLFVSVLFLSGSIFIEIALKELKRSEERDREKELLLKRADKIVELLLDDPTPFADALQDPVWEEIQDMEHKGIKAVSFKDVSSLIGINWVRKELLEKMAVLDFGKTPQELQQFREDSGIHLNIERVFHDFLEEENIEEFFTAYNYFNINISDEFVLRKLYSIRTGNMEEAEVFHTKIQNIRIEKKQLEPQDIESFLSGLNNDILFPVLNAEPVMNIHFVHEKILEDLFSYYEVPAGKAESIINLRESSEWTIDDLKTLIGEKYSETLLHHYLGCRTWFWEIYVEGEKLKLTRIIARMPEEAEEGKMEFRLVEEDFSL